MHGSTDPFFLEQDFRLCSFMQIGANTNTIIVDIVAIPVHAAIVIHVGGIVTIVARRPQPPQPDPKDKIQG